MKKFFLAVALLGALIPTFFVVHVAGGWGSWQGVPPKGTTDSLYYYARIHEVADGHPLVGNPYVYEYRGDYSPAFFLPDIISALPLLIGLPFNIAILLNVFVWSLAFLLLAFRLMRLLEIPPRWAALWTVLLYITTYSFMLRPTVMQLIYPLFLFFLITLFQFLREPYNRKRAIQLALVSALTFYFYTYLAYIVFFSLALVFLWFLYAKRYKEVKSLLNIALYCALMLIPFGLYSWMQITSVYYLETLARIGLLYTHAPSTEAYLYGRWVAIGLGALMLIEKDTIRRLFWLSTGGALLLSIFLNVFTGVELLLGVHIGRFIVLWMAALLGALAYQWYLHRDLSNHKVRYIAGALLILLLFLGVARNLPRGLDFFKFDSRGSDRTADLQAYAGPMKWLRDNVPEESVVFANLSLSQYLPIMTRHYPFYSHTAVLHNIPGAELEERKSVTPGDRAGLKKFNASYILIDRAHDDTANVSLKSALYDDGRFAIVPILQR